MCDVNLWLVYLPVNHTFTFTGPIKKNRTKGIYKDHAIKTLL